MDEKQLKALAYGFAKNLKTPEDLNQFDRRLKKISVEAALNAEVTHPLRQEKYQHKSETHVMAIPLKPSPPPTDRPNCIEPLKRR